MTPVRTPEYLADLVHECCALPRETEWLEFKVNKAEPTAIGEYISALANAAALAGKAHAYLIWGVRDDDHAIVGTTFIPHATRIGNEALENWLHRMLDPSTDFRFMEITIGEVPVVILEVPQAIHRPVSFSGRRFIRIGNQKRNLSDHPSKEAELWRILDKTPFETGVAADHLTPDDVLGLLDYSACFDLLEQPLPADKHGILDALASEQFIRRDDAGTWQILNLGAILFAKRLDRFPSLKRKAVRVIQYRDGGRIETLREQEGVKGYASGFEGLVSYITTLLPVNEVIERAFRRSVPMYPDLAVRELVANMLIHQDFSITGCGPMVEIFTDRIEITNPGAPLVDTQRFLDTPPRSRNEMLASLMRRFNICEERGSGIDKVVAQVELFQLPAPLFERPDGFTRATLFAHKPLADMTKADRIRACYQHACLRWVTRQLMTNASLRQRLGIKDENSAMVSRLLGDAIAAGVIVIADPEIGTRNRSYLPFWVARQPNPQLVV